MAGLLYQACGSLKIMNRPLGAVIRAGSGKCCSGNLLHNSAKDFLSLGILLSHLSHCVEYLQVSQTHRKDLSKSKLLKVISSYGELNFLAYKGISAQESYI